MLLVNRLQAKEQSFQYLPFCPWLSPVTLLYDFWIQYSKGLAPLSYPKHIPDQVLKHDDKYSAIFVDFPMLRCHEANQFSWGLWVWDLLFACKTLHWLTVVQLNAANLLEHLYCYLVTHIRSSIVWADFKVGISL